MTIPQSYDFSPPEELTEKKLYRNLNEMYEKISTGVNGTTRASYFTGPQQFIPTVRGKTTAGSFTYDSQTAYVLRVGNVVDFWYDIDWRTASGASGVLQIVLPYKATKFPQFPFTGTCYPGSLDIGSKLGLFARVNKLTFTADVVSYVSNQLVENFNVTSSGVLSGHIRYISIQDGGD